MAKAAKQPDAPKIEKGIPVPPISYGTGNTYPFRQMKPGDSIFVAGPTSRTGAHAAFWRKTTGWQFTQRKVEGGIRVWRVK